MARAMASVLPPGAHGTISLIGLSGYAAWVKVGAQTNASATAKVDANEENRDIYILLVSKI
jgi:hypothetical protein